jgi:hypothetical protein
MALPDRNSQKDNKRNGDPNFNWRGVVLFAIAFALIGLAVLFRGGTGYGTEEDVPYNRFLDLLEHKQIVNDPKFPLRLVVEEGRPTQSIRGFYSRPGVGNAPAQEVPFRTTIYLNFTTDLQEKLAAAKVPIAIRTESNVLAQAVIGFVPIALFLLILYFLFRQQIRMAGKGALNFGKSKARMLARDKNKITFKDVAGVEEAKDEVQELTQVQQLWQSASQQGHCIAVVNKSDLPKLAVEESQAVAVSALTGEGIPQLRRAILAVLAPEAAEGNSGELITTARHELLLSESLEAIANAGRAVEFGLPHEMLLLDCYAALRPLDAITGATTADDILNHIFSTFCIGK